MDAVATGRRNQGFTLVELMIAFTVFAFGLVAVMLMQVQAMRDGAMGRHRTGATMIAQDQIERIQNTPFSDSALDVMDPVAWTTPPWLLNDGGNPLDPGEIEVTVREPGGTVGEIVYTVFYKVEANDTVSPNTSLRVVNLEVVWEEHRVSNNKPTRTGQPTVAVATVLVDNEK